MKKYKLYLLLAALVGLTASCSRDAEESGLQTTDNSTVSISASIDPGVSTRAGGGDEYTIPDGYKLRYILEVWSTGTEAKVIHRNEQTAIELFRGVDFTFKLEKTGNYQALLWADFIDENAHTTAMSTPNEYTHYADYNYGTTENLKQISQKSLHINEESADAFFGCVDIKKEAGAYSRPFALVRPFGQVNIIEKDPALAAKVKKVKATCSIPRSFDVSTGTPGEPQEFNSDLTLRAEPSGVRKANLAYIYVFAPNKDQALLGEITLEFTPTDETTTAGITFPSFTLPANMPVERNRRTNISGTILSEAAVPSEDASLSVSVAPDWRTDDMEANPKVGDYYYKNGTWSSDLKKTTENPVIGVVWKVNADGMTGSVVSLNEPVLAWAVDGHLNATNAKSTSDGKGNTDKVFTYISENNENFANFPIFEACKNLRDATGNNGWYIPAKYNDLFKGGTSVAEQINAKITAAEGIELVVPTGSESDAYWTSQEISPEWAYRQNAYNGQNPVTKKSEQKVRFFLDF